VVRYKLFPGLLFPRLGMRNDRRKTPHSRSVSGLEKVQAGMKSYKFQVLVTVLPAGNGVPRMKLGPSPCRVVVRARNDETLRTQVFGALISSYYDGAFRPGSPSVIGTLRVAGDDVADYLHIGSHFDLWAGGDVGEGVVTRRLFI
jgi:hypothetical protein